MSNTQALIDADLLVNFTQRLFSLVNAHRDLEITVVRECLERACAAQNIKVDDLLSTFPQYGIKVVSRRNVSSLGKDNDVLANLEMLSKYVSDYDFKLETSYALSLGIPYILKDSQIDTTLINKHTTLKFISIDELESCFNVPTKIHKPDQKTLRKNSLVKRIRKHWFWILAGLIFLATLFIFPKIRGVLDPPYCPLIPNLFVSCGEKVLIEQNEDDFELFNKFQNSGITNFKNGKYQEAVKDFTSAFKEYKSPETLIYLNNSLLEAYQQKANTIAIVVPITKAIGTATNQDRDLVKEMLRGVAQVQTLVNQCLLSEQFDKLKVLPESIVNNNILCKRIQQNGKGLRVIIADDANKPNQAENLATDLNELNKKSVLAVIGHNSSDLSGAVLPDYQKNNLVLISGGSISEIDNLMKKDVFFRTVPSYSYDIDFLVKYLKENNLKKVAVFYNQDSAFSRPLVEKFKEKLESVGGKVIKEFAGKNNQDNSFTQADFNVAEAINQSQSADVFVLIPDGHTTKSFVNTIDIIKENKGNKPILGTWTLRSNRILEAVKNNPSAVTNRKLIVYNVYDSQFTPNKDYVQQGTELWGDASPNRTATNYDAAWVLVNAFLKDKNPKRTDLQKTLETIGTVKKGATGDISFDEKGNRNNLKGLLLEVIKDPTQPTGLKFVPYKP